MGEYFDQLDVTVAEHLRTLRRAVENENDEEALEALAKGWIEKEEAFAKQILERRMELVETFDPSDEDGGILLLTYSGSLLSIGPLQGDGRVATYASIGLREDVPDFAENEDSEIDGTVKAGEIVTFVRGPIRSSSKIYKMAVFSDEMDADEEEELLAEVTQLLAEDFAEVNRTIISG